MGNQAIRIDASTLQALRDESARSGEPLVRLAQRYLEEGMQLDRHPGIAYRDGPAGRRAMVIGGPDVWEVVAAARGAPERGDALIAAVADRMGIPPDKVRIAIRFYGENPAGVETFLAMVEDEAMRLERTLERERGLIG